ncbi:MAG: ABC transporter, partial [Actinomycetota bacterium]
MTMSVVQTTGVPARGGGFTGAVRSEWVKLSVRSTRWSLLGALGLVLGHVLIITLSATASHANGIEVPPMTPMGVAAISVMNVALPALVVLAALSIAGEYATGSIRSTLQWVPRRGRMLASKAAVLLPVLFACGVVLGALGAGIAKAVLGGLAVDEAGGEVVRQLAALGGYVALVGVTTVGLGAVLRSVAGTIASTIALLWVVPQVLSGLGIEVAARIADYFPGGAGMALLGA